MTTSISNIKIAINDKPAAELNDIAGAFAHHIGIKAEEALVALRQLPRAQTLFLNTLIDCWVRGRALKGAVAWLDGKSHIVEWAVLEGLERGIENCVLISGKAAATKERAGKNYLKKREKQLRAQMRGKNIVFAGRITTINDYISKEQMAELRHLPAEQQERAVKMSAQSFRNISSVGASLADHLSGETIGKRTKGELIKLTSKVLKPANTSHNHTSTLPYTKGIKTMLIIDDAFIEEGHTFINSEKAPKLAMEFGTNERFVVLPVVSGTNKVGEDRWDDATACEVFQLTEHNGWQEIGGEWALEVLTPASA